MAKAYFIRIFIWVFLNVLLCAAIILALDYFKIWTFNGYVNEFFNFGNSEKKVLQVENPFLLKDKELKKWEESLNVREQILKAREIALKEVQNYHNELMFQLKQKNDQLDARVNRFNQRQKQSNSAKAQLKDIANKLISMPPLNAVKILEGLDTLLVIDILKQIDNDAKIEDEDSITSFLLSQMDVKKVQEIIRLKEKFSSESEEMKETSFE